MKYSLLILLAYAAAVFGQPVEGPFVVIESDSAIHHIHVAARNDSVADVFYQVGNSVYHIAFALDIGMVYSGPNALDALGEDWTRRLTEVTLVDGNWAALVLDTNTIANQATVFMGTDMVDSARTVDSGVYDGWNYSSWIIDANHGLQPRYTHGFLTSWTKMTVTWLGGFWCALMVRELKEYSPDYPDGYCLEGCWWETPGFIQSLGQDCTIVLAAGWNEVMLCQLPFWSEHAFEKTLNCNIVVENFLVTQGGNYLALGTNRVVELDTANESCTVVTEFNEWPVASAADPSFGFAWLSQPSSGLLLNRADTMGTLTNPAGVVYWPEEGQRIVESNVDITANGKIVMVWMTQPSDTVASVQLWIEAVDWLTPLSTKPSDFIPHPSSLSLSAYPNPFNPATTISFDLPRDGQVTLEVYDLMGRLVRELVNQPMTAGAHQVTFDASHLASGLYWSRLNAGGTQVVRKMVLLR